MTTADTTDQDERQSKAAEDQLQSESASSHQSLPRWRDFDYVMRQRQKNPNVDMPPRRTYSSSPEDLVGIFTGNRWKRETASISTTPSRQEGIKSRSRTEAITSRERSTREASRNPQAGEDIEETVLDDEPIVVIPPKARAKAKPKRKTKNKWYYEDKEDGRATREDEFKKAAMQGAEAARKRTALRRIVDKQE